MKRPVQDRTRVRSPPASSRDIDNGTEVTANLISVFASHSLLQRPASARLLRGQALAYGDTRWINPYLKE